MTYPALPDVARLSARLGEISCRFDVDILPVCDSTNAKCLERAEQGAASGTVVVAIQQTAGRGRRGRVWISAPGDSLTFSLLWRFSAGSSLAGLSLAVGLAVARALERFGGGVASAPEEDSAHQTRLQLKWPNDVLLNGKKLGGILVELVPGASIAAVIGIGINLHLPAALPDDVREVSAEIGRAMDNAVDGAVDSNTVLATLLEELLRALGLFATAGFIALRADWMKYHAFQDVPVRLLSDFALPRLGICRGVDSDGALLFETSGGVERVLSGEVSLRLDS